MTTVVTAVEREKIASDITPLKVRSGSIDETEFGWVNCNRFPYRGNRIIDCSFEGPFLQPNVKPASSTEILYLKVKSPNENLNLISGMAMKDSVASSYPSRFLSLSLAFFPPHLSLSPSLLTYITGSGSIKCWSVQI